MLTAAWAKKGRFPQTLLVPIGRFQGTLKTGAERLGKAVVFAPEDQLLVFISLSVKPVTATANTGNLRVIRETHRRRIVEGELTGRIQGSIVCRMSTKSLSANQLAALSALIASPATKAKASITLSGNLLKVIDSLAGAAQRSAWIERAVQSYAARQLKERRRERELVLLNRHADALNAEGDESATYQANWTAE
jgi:hypothetical protein